jgi:large subunit ribosomal protein L18
MSNQIIKRNQKRIKRAWRVRKKIHGTPEQPRLSVHKTNKHVSVQLIDDENHITLASSGTLSGQHGKKSKAAAKQIGMAIAQLAQSKQITRVVFDRGRFKFHGVIAELASGAREAGLQF